MFNAEKVLQEICYLLSLNGGKLNLLKLIKELYLADRESINERDFSISGDDFFSMKNGPILSATLHILNDKDDWKDTLKKEPTKHYDDISLKKEVETDLLSENDKKYLKLISDKYKTINEWDIVDLTHKLPEWKNLKNGREKIKFSSILKALNRNEKEIAEIKEEQNNLKELKEMFV